MCTYLLPYLTVQSKGMMLALLDRKSSSPFLIPTPPPAPTDYIGLFIGQELTR